MGLSNSWIAVQGLSQADALEELGFEVDEVAGRNFQPRRFGVAELPNGWVVIMANNVDAAFKDRFAALSRHGPAVACAIEEHIMYSEARGYEAGAEVWRVIHNCEEGVDHLEVRGTPPAVVESIRSAAQKAQEAEGGDDADVDLLFDVPPDIAKSLCEFKLGDTEPYDPEFWEIGPTGAAAEPKVPKGPGFFQRLFGRR